MAIGEHVDVDAHLSAQPDGVLARCGEASLRVVEGYRAAFQAQSLVEPMLLSEHQHQIATLTGQPEQDLRSLGVVALTGNGRTKEPPPPLPSMRSSHSAVARRLAAQQHGYSLGHSPKALFLRAAAER